MDVRRVISRGARVVVHDALPGLQVVRSVRLSAHRARYQPPAPGRVHNVRFAQNQWRCTCQAGGNRCSHLRAVWLVVAREASYQ
jgi:hypothetical protein